MPEFYMIFARKMPELCAIIARKYFPKCLCVWGGDVPLCLPLSPPSCMPMRITVLNADFQTVT